ncbi:hypothetical protein HRbin01_01043 [archaeon HR01]|nr:hypothetical protein HRbin01_01043 [archaeon HR01]
MSINDWIRARHFNPDILKRELLNKTDIGYRKVMARDSSLLPLPHEKVPTPTIYVDGMPLSILSFGSQILRGETYLSNLKSLIVWLKGFLSPLFGPGKMCKLVQTERGLVLKSSNLRLIAKHITIKHPLGEFILGSGISMGKMFGDHTIYTPLLATLIVDNCLELIIGGRLKPQDCLNGLAVFNRIYEKFLDECRIYPPPREFSLRDILRFAKIIDGETYTDLLANMAFTISEIVPEETLLKRPLDNILDFRTIEMGVLSESEVVDGVALPKEFPYSGLPEKVVDAKIAIVKDGLTLPDYLGRYHRFKYVWDDGRDISQALLNRSRLLCEYVDSLVDLGANVIVVEKGVDEHVFDILERRNIMLVRGLSPPEFEMVTEATGAVPTSSLHKLEPGCLGYAESVEYRKIYGKDWVFFRGCMRSDRLTVILKGGSFAVNQDFEEKLKDAVRLSMTIKENPIFTPGAGITEIMIADRLAEYADRAGGRPALVLKAIAESFKQLAAFLYYNMGLDPLETLARPELYFDGQSILDSMSAKMAAIENAIVAANTVLRIDSFIIARKYSESEKYYLKRIRGMSKENKRKFRRDYGVETLEVT